MNLPNKLTIVRIIMSFIIIVILIFPFDAVGIELPKLFINEAIVVDIKYFIAGGLFILASLTDFLDGHIARKRNLVTDFGKVMDAIADKVLVNSVLIPVIVIIRDSVVNSIKMVAGNNGRVVAAIKSGKIKTVCLMCGIALTLFYNLPFELWNIKVSDVLLIVAAILSLISGVEYYYMNKDLLFKNNESAQ